MVYNNNIIMVGEDIYKLPIKNKKEEITYAIVDKKTFDYFSDKEYRICIDPKSKSVRISINNKTHFLHKYIYYTIYENEGEEIKSIISHKDLIKLDNRMENLKNNKLFKKENKIILDDKVKILKDHENLIKINKTEDINSVEEYVNKLPIKNKNGEICYTIVDSKTIDYLNDKKYSLSKTKTNYIQIYIDNKNHRFHRYIYYTIYENKENENNPSIDHKNSKRYDNRIENLRDETHSNNNRNKNKSEGASSIYYGVFYDKKSEAYACSLYHDNKNYRFHYQNELQAAYQYDLLVKEFNLTTARLNNISKPVDFVPKETRIKASGLPKAIHRFGSKYCYAFQGKQYGGFDTPEAAVVAHKKKTEEYNIEYENKILNEPIKRNSNGIAIIELFNDKKEKVGETLVDDDIYYELMHYRWNLDINNYVCGNVNKKNVRLSRFIMKYNGKDVIDHADGITLNNQKYNLRILSAAENAQNRSSAKNSTSKYIGVSYCKHRKNKKWVAQLKIQGVKETNIGYFLTEIEAAKARDKRAIELNTTQNTFYKLNFPV